jgi:hypothetical protein
MNFGRMRRAHLVCLAYKERMRRASGRVGLVSGPFPIAARETVGEWRRTDREVL